MRTAIYSRVSSTQQVEEGYSLQAQYEKLVEFTRLQSWDLIRVYTDPGVSAKDLKRPGVTELIEDLKADKFDAIVVHKLDRLTRNISDLYDLVELVNEKNVKLVSLSENIDTSTPMGRMFVYLLGIFAQMFRENLREEVLKGLTKRAEEGQRNTFAPLGYQFDGNGKLVIVPDQAEIVREVFDLYLNKKMGFARIVKHLNMKNTEGLRGGYFHESTVQRILSNWTYAGKNHWKQADKPEECRIIRDADHEPIIEPEIFEKTQEFIRRRSMKEMSRSSHNYPFSTILKCGCCGGSYHGAISPNAYKTYYYYRCFNRLKRGNCKQSDISEIKLEQLFFEYFQKISVEGMSYEEAAPAASDDLEKERKKIERELSKSETRRRNWNYAMGDGKLPYEDYVKLMDTEMQLVQDLQKQLAEIPVSKPVKVTKEDVVSTIINLRENWPYLERETRKGLIQALFKRITILKTEKDWKITGIDLA